MMSINLWDKYTRPALSSVAVAIGFAEASGIHCKFMLIDNVSTDNTQTEAKKILEDKGEFTNRFIYHRNEEMWGFQKSVNYGVNFFFKEGFDAVLVLNNDILLNNESIYRLVERLNVGDVGMVTCMDVAGECREPSDVYKISADEKKQNCPESESPHFSAFLVTKKCWEMVGEFDELYAPAYYEDNDYHYRMKLSGIKAVLYPPAMFFHFGSRTQNEAIGRPFTFSHNQHMFYIAKWGGSPGQEKFKAPYNDTSKIISDTKQNEAHTKS